jgi:hypothetical protein
LFLRDLATPFTPLYIISRKKTTTSEKRLHRERQQFFSVGMSAVREFTERRQFFSIWHVCNECDKEEVSSLSQTCADFQQSVNATIDCSYTGLEPE